ncbi:MAG: gamma-glutamyltransferase [Acetobacteraceae bacterium]|nr:gamma-glutamyltransferase [Acetobacteraceae bacterium]
MYLIPRTHRPLIMGRRGAVGANHPLATQAGLDILRAGGNAIDAAVAISLAYGVVEPMMSGLGGDGFYNVFLAEGAKKLVFNGTGPAPAAATAERFAKGIEIKGPLSVSVPGKLAGIGAMHADHGSLPWAQLVQHAIGYARDGYAVTHRHHDITHTCQALLAADPDSTRVFLGTDMANAELGALVVQPALARSLEMIAAEGWETFYRGTLARQLARGMASRGVMVTEADLAACQAEAGVPISITYRGFEVTQTPPNSTGFVMLEMLKIIERFDFAKLSDAERIHVMVEAKKRAFADRERFGTDPRFGEIPLARILSDAHADAQAASISMTQASTVDLDVPMAAGDTTYFCVVDAQGNCVSGIQSLNSGYGSGVTAGDTGILLNNRMAYWHLAPGHANRLVPGKRVRHTMNAPMVFKDGKLWAALGTPGADNQVQVNTQVLTAMIDLGADPQTALESPRWTSSQAGQGANWPHEGDGALSIEADFGPDTLADLAGRGHVVKQLGHLGGPCAMQAIRVLDNGVRQAGSDPRRDGWAGAY